MKKPASGAVLTAHRRLMDSVVGETTYVKAAEDMGDSIMPSMWPRNMQALLGTDRRKKRLDPQPTEIKWLGTTTTSTTAATGGVFLKEHTFVDLNHLQVLLKPASSEEESDQIFAPQQQHSSNQQVALRELYSDKQAKSLSLLQKKLRVLNIQRQEAERELLLDDQALVYEPTTVYKTDSALQNHQISSKTERKQQLFQESRYSNEEEEEGTPASSWNSSENGAQQQLQPVEEDDHDKQAGQQDWRERARALSKLLSESTKREAVLSAKLEALSSLQKRITTTATSPPSPPPPPPPSWLQQQPHLEHKQLRQQQQRDNMRRCCDSYLRFALRTAPIVVGHQDMELRYRFIYNAFPSLTEEEIIGKTDMEIYKGKGVSELTEFKYEVLRKGCPEKREIEFDTDLFGTRTFLIAVEPVFGLSGDAIGINFWAMDVTEQAEKRDRMASLREQVAVQKAMETELNKTIHITEETMQAKEMLVTMSHEIRSPLSGVVSMAEVLATTDLDTEQRQLVDVMVSSGDLVLQLINNILDLSKVQSGAMKFEAKKFQLREVVRHVLQMARASVKNKSLVLEADIHPSVPLELIGDVLRIHQVFINLVSNAIKFTHNGGVTIAIQVVSPDPPDLAMEKSEGEKLPSLLPWSGSLTLDAGSHKTQIPVQPNLLSGQKSLNELSNPTTTAEEVETIWLQCDIHDTGIGIPDEALPTLFDKYTQVNAHQNYGGTGLGLAICKNLVELMGGALNVTSKENVGSTFSFKLPLQVTKEKDLARQQASKNGVSVPMGETRAKISTDSSSAAPQSSGPHRALRVLLAEDNKVNIMVAQSMLKRLGHTLEAVGNGADVIQALQRSSYDLILMDIHMPIMNGLEATKRIRRFEKTGSWTSPDSLELSPEFCISDALPARIPIIAMTANALHDNVEECFRHGMDSFIAKPVTFTKLEQVLKQLFP
ncbi:unnamed protein product [Sphagnum jensenii]|uniref:histidine kinase n=1 Tax=Sphagnum jensenii TaxID=128206 RepID=A0ABP1BGP5_9BRYO